MKRILTLLLSAMMLISVVSFSRVSADNTHQVIYVLEGDVTEEMIQNLPETEDYPAGETVTVDRGPWSIPQGYSFHGWDRNGTFTMPDEDVVITGEVRKLNDNKIYSVYTFSANLNLNRQKYTNTGHGSDAEKDATKASPAIRLASRPPAKPPMPSQTTARQD